MVLLQGSLILWKSSRQPMVTLSTAEAELLEVVESLTMGESIAVVANELGPESLKGVLVRQPSSCINFGF